MVKQNSEVKTKTNSKKPTTKKSTTSKPIKKATPKKPTTNKTVKEVKIEKVNKPTKKITKRNNENYFSALEVIVLIFATVIVSFVIGCLVTYNLNKNKAFKNDKYLEELIKKYNNINNKYNKKVKKEK